MDISTLSTRTLAQARTLLFVPGDRPERFDKAWASGADGLVLDLEDAVPAAAKASARTAIAQVLHGWSAEQRGRTVVRINPADSPDAAADLALLASSPLCGGLMLAKADTVAALAGVRAAVPGASLLPLIESARGVLAAEALTAAPGVLRLVFGTLDWVLDMDASGDPIGLDPVASRLALASRGAGIAAPVAGVSTDLNDEAALLADLARARAHGFGGKLCIHPRQVAPIHRALQPSAADIRQAQRILAAAAAAHGAAVQVDGRMVDAPVIERARRLLARA